MWIKLCANTNVEDALLAAKMGADAVGFVFAPSKRRVNAEQVAAITAKLPASVEAIGVFHALDGVEILETAQAAGLTGVQLHGAFDPTLVSALTVATEGRLRLIQTVKYALDAEDRSAADAAFTAELRAALTEPEIDAALLDAAQGGASGGLGMAFDWEHVAPLVRGVVDQLEAESGERPRVIVAGGLRVENVERAIALFQPWGVDVASGVEAGPGKKDAARLRAFLEAARAGFATLKG